MRDWLASHVRLERSFGAVLVIAASYAFGVVSGVLSDRAYHAGVTGVPTPAGLLLIEPTPVAVSAERVIVHVSGAVERPGVYELLEGQRVRDAIESAGGVTTAADLHALNLAAPLRDGQKIVVPLASDGSVGTRASSAQESSPVNLNSASQAQLETLPGVGPVTAERIVRDRQVNGAFGSVEELRTRSLVNESTFERIRDLVSAG